jgi:hypothetical protein
MASPFKIEVRISDGAWEDVTGYVEAGSWGGSDVVAENGLLNYTAGNMSFQLCDKDTGIATHDWVTRLAGSTVDAEVRVTYNATAKVIFFGYVEPGLLTWEGDCITGFTATSVQQNRRGTGA